MNTVTKLSKIDGDYKCVIVKPKNKIVLKSEKVETKGWWAKLPSRDVLVTRDGRVLISNGRRGKLEEFFAIECFARAVMNTTVIENFSGPVSPTSRRTSSR